MSDSTAAPRAAWLLALGLVLLAWPRPPRPVEPCPRPVLERPDLIRCAPAGTETPRLAGVPRRIFGLAIDPNRADASTLETLPGIGPVRAEAILRERSRRPFRDLDDLERVPGLGPRRVAALAPYVDFEPALASSEAPSVESPDCRRDSWDSRPPGDHVPNPPCGEDP